MSLQVRGGLQRRGKSNWGGVGDNRKIYQFQRYLKTINAINFYVYHLNTSLGSDLARGSGTWSPFAVRAEDERGVDQEEQPRRGRRLQQLQPGEPRPAIKIHPIYL